ncbi:UvrD/REP helicase N-terminal domain-containing protein [Actinobaculum suis]|uniref:DNA 3'-5' helicase n=1 Tax=Actinobaculum suis TaxID=1657 RepID=A0A1G7AB76_9ACTO|nr:UvrD-helicase domain-containing protein [Actinobaculum suis]MDY5152621.1 3'-5' exonuclease [Actinobaculum suis]SDE12051.1 UvrD/REP helicase N-terminal domain-containing protein [Actinobaculum suis]
MEIYEPPAGQVILGKKVSSDTRGDVRTLAMNYLVSLQRTPEERRAAGTPIQMEKVPGAADPRARLGVISENYRSLVFELVGEDGGRKYVYEALFPVAEARDIAQRVVISINPVNGVPEITEVEAPAAPAAASGVPATVPAPTAGPRLVDTLPAPEVMHERIGIDLATAQAVREIVARTNSAQAPELTAVLASRPAWEQDAISSLLAGLSVEETLESLGIETSATPPDAQDPQNSQAVIDSFALPAAQAHYTFLEKDDKEALRRVLDTKNFGDWLTFLHPSQRGIVEGNLSKVSGGAGTGKTVVVLHRTDRLLRESPVENPRILLTTFTRALANSLQDQMSRLTPGYPRATAPGAPGLTIMGVDAVARYVVDNASRAEIEAASAGVFGVTFRDKPRVLSAKAEEQLWHQAVAFTPQLENPELQSTDFLRSELEDIVFGHEISTWPEYARVKRTGRGRALNRRQRKGVWETCAAYLRLCSESGRLPWSGMAILAARLVRGKPLFDHTLIDEAQDFSAPHWRFLRAATREGRNDIFLAEDSHQRIYGRQLTLSHYGIHTRGSSRRLTLNYRTTRENLSYAIRLLEGGDWRDSAGESENLAGYRSARSGPEPQIIACTGLPEEISLAAAYINRWLGHTSAATNDAGSAAAGATGANPSVQIGVLVRTNRLVTTVRTGIANHGVDTRDVSFMTMHNAKGLEFTHVIMMGVDERHVPFLREGLGDVERDEAENRERALLYVAASRARDQLVITYSGEASELLAE